MYDKAATQRSSLVRWSSNCLRVVVVTVDGKALGKLTQHAEGDAMRQTEQGGSAFWYVRLLRAVLSSASGKPCLGQKTIP
jgi:hypothetical protein